MGACVSSPDCAERCGDDQGAQRDLEGVYAQGTASQSWPIGGDAAKRVIGFMEAGLEDIQEANTAMHSALMSLTPEDHDATTLASSSFSERPSVRSRLEAAAQLSHHPFKQHISFSSIDHELQQSTEDALTLPQQAAWQVPSPFGQQASPQFDSTFSGLQSRPSQPEFIVVDQLLGTGGYGNVYRATWQQSRAAVKVMYTHDNEHEAAAHALEMAVLSSVQHPNIPQTYACLTDMVDCDATDPLDDASSVHSASTAAGAMTSGRRYRRLQPGEEVPTHSLCNVLVMELCDAGTLRDALNDGLFTSDFTAAAEILLDVAAALHCLHSMQLVHGNVKPENVFLKTCTSRRMGVIAKLGDFSLCSIMDEKGRALGLKTASVIGDDGEDGDDAPTTQVTLCGREDGAHNTQADDVSSFGTLMWEMLSQCGVVKQGLPGPLTSQDITTCSVDEGLASSYAMLAAACWSAPAQRLTMEDVIDRLEHLVETGVWLAEL